MMKKRENDETNTRMQYTIDALYINNGTLKLCTLLDCNIIPPVRRYLKEYKYFRC